MKEDSDVILHKKQRQWLQMLLTKDENSLRHAYMMKEQWDSNYKEYQRKINGGIASMMMVNETEPQKHNATGTLK